MWKSFSAAREAATTIPCKECRTRLIARRSCLHVYLHCPSCDHNYDVREYISIMDEELEKFLEAVNCDRV